jgi:hypothetical protein
MTDYSILKTKLADPAITALPDEQARANYLNDKTITKTIPIPTSRIKAYLAGVGKWRALADSTDVNAKDAMDMLSLFNEFDITQSVYLTRLTQVLDNLVALDLISETDKSVVLSFGNTLVSWADENWSGDVTLTDIQNAREYV